MNILVIGNGFDLAHGLPTKYTDFLEFVKVIKQAISKGKLAGIDWGNTNTEVKKFLISNKGKVQEKLFSNRQMWEDLVNNNFWIDYFLPIYTDRKRNGKDGWIDFEGEISEVVQSLDADMHGLSQMYNIEDIVHNLSNNFLKEIYSDYIDAVQPINPADNGFSEGISFKIIRDRLLNDLNKLIRALEIYLTEYVNKALHNEELSIIKDVFEKKDEQGNIVAFIDTKILSFNYTETFKRVYKQGFDIDYIHGKASIENSIGTNNMVLGIDEYLPKKRRDRDTEFIAFKKFYQRIHKETGCKYKEWLDIIKGEFVDYQNELERCKKERNIMNLKATVNQLKKQYLNKHHVYIFGHSLDVTDRDILRDLILNDNVHITIFYHDKDVMGQQIANLVKVIGQDELIRRTGGKDKLIEFKPTKPMKEIKES